MSMKKLLITFFTVLFCLTSSVVWSLEFKELVKRDGVYYKKFSEVPFTGKVDGKEQGSFKNGLKEGSWVQYHENGQLFYKGDYKNGKKEGSWVWYYHSGQLSYKGDYKNGKEEGSWVSYKRDGTFNSGTYKNGKRFTN